MKKQPEPLTWKVLSRHTWFDEELLARRQSTYTVDDLRKMLAGWTWAKLLQHQLSVSREGVMFHARIGRFMNMPCIAVCALGHIVVLRYLAGYGVRSDDWSVGAERVIDGTRNGGLLLVNGDFLSGRTGNIKLGDLLIGEGP